MTPYLTRSFGNPSGIHRMAREAAVALGEARGTMARLLGAEHADEIYFTSGGSESDNWILRGAVRRFRDAYGERAVPHIVTSAPSTTPSCTAVRPLRPKAFASHICRLTPWAAFTLRS
ncbi:MAG: aminotransferase class V-fold PLP-dependent enzyme [Collinsella sp.]